MKRLLLLGVLGCSGDDGGGPRIYAPTETMAFDCHAGPGRAIDPRRPQELLGSDVVSSDGGATYRYILDEAARGVRLGAGETGIPYSLGDGRWVANARDQLLLIDARTATARHLTTTPMIGPDLQFRSADLGDGTFVGVGGRGRFWTSTDNLAWTGLDGEFYGTGLSTGCTLYARGDRAWLGCSNAANTVDVSSNGGRTLTRVTLPAPYTRLLHLGLGSGGKLAAIFGDDGMSGEQPWIWLSDDDGATWSYAAGDPDWIFRQTTVRVYVLADDTLIANGDLNLDAAAPNPAGRYWLASRDFGASWSIVLSTSGGEEITAFPPLTPAGGSRFVFATKDALCVGPVDGAGTFTRDFTIVPLGAAR